MALPHDVAEAVRALALTPGATADAHDQLVAELNRVSRLSPDEYAPAMIRDLTERAHRKARRLHDEVDGMARTAHDKAACWLDSRPAAPTDEAVLAELREQRAWARHRALLGAGVPAQELIDGARDAGDHHALAALRAELPAYARTSGNPAVGAGLDVHLAAVDDALGEVLPEARDQRAAHRLRRDLAEAWPAAERAIESSAAQLGRLADDPDGAHLRWATRLGDVRENAGRTFRPHAGRTGGAEGDPGAGGGAVHGAAGAEVGAAGTGGAA